MTNPIILTCYNRTREQHELTLEAFESACAQDIPVEILVVDNGSTFPATAEWVRSLTTPTLVFPVNTAPTRVGNLAVARALEASPHVLSIPNDVILPPNCYSELLRFPHGFVSAGTASAERNPPPRCATFLHHDCHFSVILTRRWAFDALMTTYGQFLDESYFHYASDCDMKKRWHEIGLQGAQTDLQVWHYGSASWRLSTDPERREMLLQADRDRETYFQKWGERL